MKIQLDIPEELMKKIAITKIQDDLTTKAEVILEILKRYYQNG